MEKSFELLEHTADMGIRAFGRSLPELYENAARGMMGQLVSGASVRPVSEEQVVVEGTDAVELLVAWLHEILYRFDVKRRAFAEVCVVEFSEWRIAATLRGEPLDLSRHECELEIKAVTYHGARVEHTADGWVADVFLDI